jgi:hypothetical protein
VVGLGGDAAFATIRGDAIQRIRVTIIATKIAGTRPHSQTVKLEAESYQKQFLQALRYRPGDLAKLYVVRHEFTKDREPGLKSGLRSSLRLLSLDEPTVMVRFDTYDSEEEARKGGVDLYDLLFEVKGTWMAPPTHAVFAEWDIADSRRIGDFIESKRKLFELRRRVLDTFAYDWLLRRVGIEGRYVILGLYGDEEGATRLCCEHPEIHRFIQDNPSGDFAARDLTGLRCFLVLPGAEQSQRT